jgi:hypothetical protein
MHFGIHTAIVRLLINNKPFRASLDDCHVILGVHRADFDRNRGKIRRERAHAFD